MRTVAFIGGGPQVSVVGLGCNNFGLSPFGKYTAYEQCKPVVDAALDAGYTLFDTADAYGAGESEEILGRALGSARDAVVIATKFGYPMPDAPDVTNGTREYVRWAIEGSLRRLDTDYVDLLQIHRPDPEVPIIETLGYLAELVDEGKVRLVGVSGFSPDLLEEAHSAGARPSAAPVVTCMTHYSLITRDPEADLIPVCLEHDITLLPYFPLESGLLTGKYTRDGVPEGARLTDRTADISEATWHRLQELQSLASSFGISLLELAIGGLAAMPAVRALVVGATKPEQVRENARAGDWVPSPRELAALTADGVGVGRSPDGAS